MVAGNWKMNNTVSMSGKLVSELLPRIGPIDNVEKVLCPPYPALFAVSTMLEGTDIGLGAQNMHWEASGAFTGEISPAMVAELCDYVIIGHSERRTYFGETDEAVHRKVQAALEIGLVPIVCVGELLEEREAGRTAEVVRRQVNEGLSGIVLRGGNQLVIAYEPVWAIGTGKAATPEGANGVIGNVIRPTLAALFGEEIARAIRVLYGGSISASNAASFFSQAEIDGGLVGGASLKADEFTKITEAAVYSL
ncbi:MAG: triose-phosphate isomerase [Chloroflexota bacterium]